MSNIRSLAMEGLAALVGLGTVIGESLKAPAIADSNGNDEFPGQRLGGGTHFRERIHRAKHIGHLPGLRKMAAKLRQPRQESVLAQYTPDKDTHSPQA